VDLDLAKGSLVLLMIIYHCASMASLTPAYQQYAAAITARIHFISRAFLLLSGLLCGIHYLPKLKDSPTKTRRRLLIRGLKLLLIFVGLNLSLYFIEGILVNRSLDYSKITNNMLLILGSLPGDIFAFSILYYISMLLIVLSLILGRINLIYLLVIFLIVNGYNLLIINALTYGIIGVLIGELIRNDKMTRLLWPLERGRGLPLVVLVAIQLLFYDNLINYSISSLFLVRVIIYCIEIILWLLSLVYLINVLNINKITNLICLLGKYTLISYIIQMIVIRINYDILKKLVLMFWYYYMLNIVLSGIILYAIIYCIDYVRKLYPSGWVNKGYETIFN